MCAASTKRQKSEWAKNRASKKRRQATEQLIQRRNEFEWQGNENCLTCWKWMRQKNPSNGVTDDDVEKKKKGKTTEPNEMNENKRKIFIAEVEFSLSKLTVTFCDAKIK